MARAKIDQLIINSAFKEPKSHWKYDLKSESFIRENGRRPAGYFVAGKASNKYNDIGVFVELPLVNSIRIRVKTWREKGYPGVTGITKKLLHYWSNNEERLNQFFFCQIDAIETLIWLTEAPDSEKIGIKIPTDGGEFRRICSKMATGTGKTVVMAMVIAWQILNKTTYPLDKRFSKNIFIVAPGLTVKSRLQVLSINSKDNYYSKFNIVPNSLMDKLRQGKVIIENWHTLSWESDEEIRKKKSVDKRGAKSDEAYTREVLGELSCYRNILVINDEAHHAWRINPEMKIKKNIKDDVNEATIWINGLDRIHKTRGILTCYDFSATPFAPSGKKNNEESLFEWIVSDFGLNDAIESGLVKTPRVVIKDDALPDINTYKSKLYHLYMDETIKDDINRAANKEEPIPDLLNNAYRLLGLDWLETFNEWKASGVDIPPVMISVVNRTETAARIKYAFDHKKIKIDELCNEELTIQIDSKVIEKIENNQSDGNRSKKEMAKVLRETVDTVGQKGKLGEKIRNVISVGMLSEGWDAKTVTHIMGLRAFSSQLLCEQVIGRGLRRTSYDINEENGLFSAEYVNIFGIPFTFLPHESDESTKGGKPTTPKIQIEPLNEKIKYRINWPNIIRVDRIFNSKLSVDLSNIEPLYLEASDTRLHAELAPIIDGKADINKCTDIDLEKLDSNLRMQKIIFETSSDIYDIMQSSWKKESTKFNLIGQIIKLVEEFIRSDKIIINPELFETSYIRRKIILMLNMNKIVQHLWGYIKLKQTEKLLPIFDINKRILSTENMNIWYTSKPCAVTRKSHISHCVYDSTWEASEAFKLDKNDKVTSWVKNDHLGFEILYIYDGVIRKYRPDFIICLKNGTTLILETKGQETRRDREKRKALKEWIEAVNETGEFGRWVSDISYNVADVDGIINRHCFFE